LKLVSPFAPYARFQNCISLYTIAASIVHAKLDNRRDEELQLQPFSFPKHGHHPNKPLKSYSEWSHPYCH